ncbi:MAG: cofactor-independent phosphoglycerate mutase [Thermoleophilia bacterium]|nr:cofactor-independent phosphoglycerate mutase [Thermoleophilia bacterium]
MKYLILIPDGSADQPRDELGGQTPLQAASTPNSARLATAGSIGLVQTIPEDLPAGSDVANLCVMGYNPHEYYTGRAPLEAASLGLRMYPGDVAFRCNLVHVEDGVMRDFSAGHIGTEEATRLLALVQQDLGGAEASFYPGLSYRHIMISRGKGLRAACTPPHDITGQPVAGHLPEGEDAGWLRGLMESSARLLEDHPVNAARVARGEAPANMIWLWGQGTAPRLPRFRERFGLDGSVISAVDLVKGLGTYAGLKVVRVPGATGWLDTDYAAKGRSALEELEQRDLVYVHVEAPDEASHAGDVKEKIKAIERFDADLLGTILSGLDSFPEHRILMLPDHATPLSTKTHNHDPVPFLFYDPSRPAQGQGLAFDEESARQSGWKFMRGWELMEWFIRSG